MAMENDPKYRWATKVHGHFPWPQEITIASSVRCSWPFHGAGKSSWPPTYTSLLHKNFGDWGFGPHKTSSKKKSSMDWHAKTSLRGGLTMTFSEDWMSILQPSYRIAFECSLLSMLPCCKGEQCITSAIPSNNWAQSLDVAVRQPLSAVLRQTNSEAGQTFQDNIEYHFPSGHLYCSK